LLPTIDDVHAVRSGTARESASSSIAFHREKKKVRLASTVIFFANEGEEKREGGGKGKRGMFPCHVGLQNKERKEPRSPTYATNGKEEDSPWW